MNDVTEPATDVAPLRLVALDAEDLSVISAHLQDATMRVGDMAHLPKMRRFALVGARFDWPLARQDRFERCAVGLHFETVIKVMRVGFDQDPERELRLLAIVFLAGSAPSGTVMLSFAGGSAIRLEVECLEVSLSDVGPRWAVDRRPDEPEAAS